MLEHYKGIYRDQHGNEEIVIANDGEDLSMMLRGVAFKGQHIMRMFLEDPTDRPELNSFTLRGGHDYVELCGCTIDYEMTIPVARQILPHFLSMLGNRLIVIPLQKANSRFPQSSVFPSKLAALIPILCN